ncbi:sensor histidine kinase [Filimonas effusa]|nr:HAMP domain-containing sensor histidine kinase [Filimonas effusa]
MKSSIYIDELKTSEERFLRAFEHSAIGMALVSTEGQLMKVNRNLCEMTGYTEVELHQKTFQELTHPDDLAKDLDCAHQLLRGEINDYQIEKRYFHKNGNIIWVLLSVSLVRDRLGRPVHFVSHIEDITSRKETELQLRYTNELAREQNNRLVNFAHIVSHNLRAHSGNFEMLLYMIDQAESEDEKNELMQHLKKVSSLLSETIVHLNEVVSIQSSIGQQKIKLNLLEYINNTAGILAAEITLHQVTINVNVPDNVEIDYNPAYLESILLNLVSNTIKYRHPDRQLIVNISFEEIDGKKILCVSDNGKGLNLERYGKKLFGMYNTFHGNRDAKGIGLFIVKNQVESMGGKIEVSSEVNNGATFKIYIT